MRKQPVIIESPGSVSPPARRFLQFIIIIILLFGLILVPGIGKADGVTADYIKNDMVSVPAIAPQAVASMIPGMSQNANSDTDNISEPPPSNQLTGASIPTAQLNPNDEDEETPEIRVEYRDIIHYIDREVIKEVTVEKPVTLGEFASLDELETWLAGDDTNEYIHLFAGNDGVCQPGDRYDCDDYAFQLQQRAVKSGFLMSVTIIKQLGKNHMINLACIDNDIYYIEPQSDKVWFFCNKD